MKQIKFLFKISIDVVVARALISLEVEDIAALKITASSKPINPLGRLSRMKFINT